MQQDKLFIEARKQVQNLDSFAKIPPSSLEFQELQKLIQSCFDASMLLQLQELPKAYLNALENINTLLQENNSKKISIALSMLHLLNEKLTHDGLIMAKACQEQGQAFVCHKGCAGCCHHLVMCDAIEALLIASHLNSHPDVKQIFQKNYALWNEQTINMRISYMAWAKELYSNGHDNGSHNLSDYVYACPFLDEHNCCIIYNVRVYACRSTISVNPLCCDVAQGSGKHTMQYSLYTGHHIVRKSLMKMCNDSLFSTELKSMPEVVASLID